MLLGVETVCFITSAPEAVFTPSNLKLQEFVFLVHWLNHYAQCTEDVKSLSLLAIVLKIYLRSEDYFLQEVPFMENYRNRL